MANLSAAKSTVFVVIPVFNRIHHTLHCIELLKRQTYSHIQIIVSDGGSTDLTPELVPHHYPDVVVLTTQKELWWSGAMAAGIDWTLQAATSSDFVLMMNNDTEFDEHFVAMLVRVAQTEKAAVGALTCDIHDREKVLDAGVSINWTNYTYEIKTVVPQDITFDDSLNLLPGRGTLVPVSFIHKAGNINVKALPHYLGDYEYFYRLHRLGLRMGITFEAKIYSDTGTTGLSTDESRALTLKQCWQLLFSRRSMTNIKDHLTFIYLSAPEKKWLRPFLHLMISEIRWFSEHAEYGPKRLLRTAALALIPPRYVTLEDCQKRELSLEALTKQGILCKPDAKGRSRFPLRTILRRFRDQRIEDLYQHAQREGQQISHSTHPPSASM